MSDHIDQNASSQHQSGDDAAEHSNDQAISPSEDPSISSRQSSTEHSYDQQIEQSNDQSNDAPPPSRPPVTNVTDPTPQEWIQLFEDMKEYKKSQVQRNNPGLSYVTLSRRNQFYLEGKVEKATKKLAPYKSTGIRKKRKASDESDESSDDDYDDFDDSDVDDSVSVNFGTVNRDLNLTNRRASQDSDHNTPVNQSDDQTSTQSISPSNETQLLPKRGRCRPRKNPQPSTQSQTMQPTISPSDEMDQSEINQPESINQTESSEEEIIMKWEQDQIAIIREIAQQARQGLSTGRVA